jgi:energy-coupling factor transporter ATP-binding protein EcfA2
MKIDLHCHTKAIKKGDGAGRNVTPELFQSKTENADVKIVAITNHNSFDIKQYNDLVEVVRGKCLIWPGVELDVLEPGSKRWHLIVVVNPNEVEEFSTSVATLFNGANIEECTRNLDEICAAFKSLDAIYIAHFHKKPVMPEEDGIKLESLIGEKYRVFKETSNEKSMSVFANFRHNVLVGSDVKDWNSYEDCSFAELRLPVDSFEQFCLLARRDEIVVQTLLNKKDSKRLLAHPAANVYLSLQIFADMNIVFGQKGTGKTEIVKSLYESMKLTGLHCVRYVASDREEEFKTLLNNTGFVPDLEKMGVDDCKVDFETISNWVDGNPVPFENYLNWKNTEGNNTNKTRMRITRSSFMTKTSNEKEDIHIKDKKNIDNLLKYKKKIDINEYLNEEDSKKLEALIKKLQENIYIKRLDDLIDEETVELVNFSITKIKEIADKSTNSVSKPSSTGFFSYVEKRLMLYKAIRNILKSLSANEVNEREKIGWLDEKGDILINTRFRMLCTTSKAVEFKKPIKKLKEIKEIVVYLGNHIFDSDISEQIQQFKDLCEELKITSIQPFVGCSKIVINMEGEEYTPSNGEKGMLLLQRALMVDADAYFLDEPELGMGNSYIDTTIRPMLVGLSKRHKYVVVATHNANIAVRTLPYTSIYRTHSNGVYSTYVGNPFSDKLVNIDNKEDVLNWANESLKSLEGSKDAFYERKDIYESNHS